MEDPTVIVKISDKIKPGEYKQDRQIGLATLHSLNLQEIKSDPRIGLMKKSYRVNAKVTHPVFGDMSFSFDFVPLDKTSNNFKNAKGHNICAGTPPHGELKDIVIAALTHESYAFQLSLVRNTWIHAENNPEDGTYLIWFYQYNGRYSPRSTWRLPKRCETEGLWKASPGRKQICNTCAGTKCELLALRCTLCGAPTSNVCPICRTPTCQKHSHCQNKHYNLTPDGMFEGRCRGCGAKIPIGRKKCTICQTDARQGTLNHF